MHYCLQHSLCHRDIDAKGSTIHVAYTVTQAQDARDNLGKTLYGKLFNWLVAKINETFHDNDDAISQCKSIGVLDIFGFEVNLRLIFLLVCMSIGITAYISIVDIREELL